MKNFLSVCLGLLISANLYAQTLSNNLDLRPLLFKNFITGTVSFNNNSETNALLNYNTDQETIVYVEGNQLMELSALNTISKVVLDNATFIPVGNKFYQITDEPNLLISYTNKILPAGVAADKVGTTTKNIGEVSNTVNTYINGGYKNKNNLQYLKQYWYRAANGNLVKFSTIKEIANALHIDKNNAEAYIKDNHLQITNNNDLIALIKNFAR